MRRRRSDSDSGPPTRLKNHPANRATWTGQVAVLTAIHLAVASAVAAPLETPVVVVLGTAEDAAMAGRLAAELRAVGMTPDVRIASSQDADLGFQIDALLVDGVRAAVRVDAGAGRIEVAIADPTSRRLALRQVLEAPDALEAEAVLAMRTVEFVRAMLLGPTATPPPPPQIANGPTRSAPPTEAARSTEPPLFGVAVVSGVAAASGGLGAQAEVGIQACVGLGRLAGVELFALAPLTTEPVPGTAATNARASIWLAGGGLFARRAGKAGAAELGAGFLAVALRVFGEPAPGWSGSTDTRTGAATYGRLGATFAIYRSLAVRGELLAGGVFRRPVASAGGPGTYPWGPLFVVALGGVEVRWF